MELVKKYKKWLITLIVFCSTTMATYSYVSNTYVMYNVKSHIYHKPTCEWAIKCTVNCIMIKKEEAIKIGRPCKVCGG